MLMTKLKSEEVIGSLTSGKVFIINCHGCKEVGFPEEEAKALQKKLQEEGKVVGILTTDYVCNPEELALRLRAPMAKIAEADAVLVFSCGVGVQTISQMLEDKPVYACCDTIELPGFQGVTPLEYDCGQCGECFLNLTGGICPITACSKSLVNGPCGGTKNGKCEVNPENDCAWIQIYKRLEQLGHGIDGRAVRLHGGQAAQGGRVGIGELAAQGAAERDIIEDDGAAVHGFQLVQTPQKRAFPRSARADQRHDLALLHVQVDAPEHAQPVEALVNPGCAQHADALLPNGNSSSCARPACTAARPRR